jgi:hypothetical protein
MIVCVLGCGKATRDGVSRGCRVTETRELTLHVITNYSSY